MRTQIPFFGKVESRLRRAAHNATAQNDHDTAKEFASKIESRIANKMKAHAKQPRRVAPIRRNAQ